MNCVCGVKGVHVNGWCVAGITYTYKLRPN